MIKLLPEEQRCLGFNCHLAEECLRQCDRDGKTTVSRMLYYSGSGKCPHFIQKESENGTGGDHTAG